MALPLLLFFKVTFPTYLILRRNVWENSCLQCTVLYNIRNCARFHSQNASRNRISGTLDFKIFSEPPKTVSRLRREFRSPKNEDLPTPLRLWLCFLSRCKLDALRSCRMFNFSLVSLFSICMHACMAAKPTTE